MVALCLIIIHYYLFLVLFIFIYLQYFVLFSSSARDYRGSRESLNSALTYNARRGSNASFYEGIIIIYASVFALIPVCH